MEKVTIYAVYDKKAERYDTPFFAMNDLFAERRFVMSIEDNKSIISRFKNDFQLVRLGFFNVLDGVMEQDMQVVREGVQINKGDDSV